MKTSRDLQWPHVFLTGDDGPGLLGMSIPGCRGLARAIRSTDERLPRFSAVACGGKARIRRSSATRKAGEGTAFKSPEIAHGLIVFTGHALQLH